MHRDDAPDSRNLQRFLVVHWLRFFFFQVISNPPLLLMHTIEWSFNDLSKDLFK